MADRRIEFSLNSLQIILLISGGLLILVLTFALGVMVGNGHTGSLSLFDKDVKSQVVKMKVGSPPPVQSPPHTDAGEEKTAVMKNTTSKPVMTFYDTLAKQNGKTHEAPIPKALPEPKKMATETGNQKKFTLQVGAMKEKESADALVSKLKKFGYSASIVPPSGSVTKNGLYKVRIGTFSNKDDAMKEADRIKRNEGLTAIAVEK